jgi:hypothetical protein
MTKITMSWRLASRLGVQPHRSITALSLKSVFKGERPGNSNSDFLEIRTPLGTMFWPLVPAEAKTKGADK